MRDCVAVDIQPSKGLANARPLTIDGQVACTHPRAGSIEIRVKDSGVGLTKEQLQRLFREGVQFDANRLPHGGGSGRDWTSIVEVVCQTDHTNFGFVVDPDTTATLEERM